MTFDHRFNTLSLTLSGKDGADADRYQERDVKNALQDLQTLDEENTL